MAYMNTQEDANLPKIAVVGVGGAGCNVVSAFYGALCNMTTIAINTDKAALRERTQADEKIYICKEVLKGEGAKGDAALGKTCAEIHIDEIKQALAGHDFVFVVGAVGGGTGTGAMPVIIEASQSQGIDTFAIVIQPFSFEGRDEVSRIGLHHIRSVCPKVELVSNEKVLELMPNLTFNAAFAAVNMSILRKVTEVADMIVDDSKMRMQHETVGEPLPEYNIKQLSVVES